jgi:hypothetical protein
MENDSHDSASLEAEDPVTVSLGPMGCLFQQLRSAISWQYRRLKAVEAEIQILGEGLEGLCTDLKDFSEAEDTITRCWVRQVRDLCYDTSDYLDELMQFIQYSSGTRPRMRLFSENHLGSKIFRVSRRPACSQLLLSLPKLKRVPLIAKLSALVARAEEADERRTRFKLSPPQASKHHHYVQPGVSQIMPQLTLQPHVDNLVKLLGFDDDHNERNLEVATILGSEGVGKTAVARILYHKYRGRFQYRAFLRVSRDPDTRRLLTDLLSQIKAPLAHAFSDIKQLIVSITKHLQRKRYFQSIKLKWCLRFNKWCLYTPSIPTNKVCTHFKICL